MLFKTFSVLAANTVLALSLVLAPLDAWAYLDPGTGSMLLSVIIGLASSVYFFLRRLPDLVRTGLFRIKGGRAQLKRQKIVFYAESASYWGTFEPILKALSALGAGATYLTSAKNDPVFSAGIKGIEAQYIGEGNLAYTSLGFLEADVFVLTTPGIDVLQIRRSKGVRQYVHVVHAATDIHTYKLFSFDYYDAVFCSGPHQASSLRELERKRKTKPKYLPLLGCPYFDRLVEQNKGQTTSVEPQTVLIAPTWGRNSLLTRTGSLIPKMLADAGYRVILRPHPQSFISDKALMDSLSEELSSYANIEWDRAPSGFNSLSRAALMVSDLSGVVFDYAFVFERPVVTLGDGPLKDGFEAWELDEPAWEMRILDQLGHHLKAGEEGQIVEVVQQLLNNIERHKNAIRTIRNESIVNFGAAAHPIAKALVKMAQECAGEK